MRFQASHWLACVLICSAVLAAAAWRGPDSRPGQVIAEAAQDSTPRAGIAAVYHPGPEYRAYSEADEEADRRSKEGRYPKHAHEHSRPHHDDALDRKSYGPYKPYPEPRPEYKPHPREGDPKRHYTDKDEQHRPHDDRQPAYPEEPSYSRHDSHDRPQPYEIPEHRAAYEQPPYEKQDSYNKFAYREDEDKPSSYQQQPAYGEQRPQEQDYKPYKPYQPYEDSSRSAYGKDSYGKETYGKDSYGKDSYDRDGPYDTASPSEGYNGREEEEEYDAPYDPYGGGEASYGKPQSHICLQESKRTTVPSTDSDDALTVKFTSTFQCCSRDDAPDACLAANRTDSYEYYSSYPSFRSDSLLDTYLSPPSAATCNWQYTSSLCPPHLLETCMGAGKLSCVLSADAKSCGAPTRKLQFVAEGWFIGAEALSCDAFYDPSASQPMQIPRRGLATAAADPVPAAAADPVTPQYIVQDDPEEESATTEDDGLVSAVAWVFQGKIKLVKNGDGYQEGRGTVRFVASFGQAPDEDGSRRTTRNSVFGNSVFGRRLMEEEASKAAAPAAAGNPAPAAAAAAPAAKATDNKTPAAAPAAAKETDAKAPAAAAAPVATVSDAKATDAKAPAAAPAGTPAPATVLGGYYEPDYGSSYGGYGGSDLPIVKGGSLSITLYDSYDDKDQYKY